MAKNIQRIADILGAKIVGEVPETGGGAFGAYRLAEIVARLQARVKPAEAKRPNGPAANGNHQHELPLSEETFKKLEDLAAKVSTNDHAVAPMQLAVELLEDAIGRSMDYLRREADAGRRADFEKYLATVPNVAPAQDDRFPKQG